MRQICCFRCASRSYKRFSASGWLRPPDPRPGAPPPEPRYGLALPRSPCPGLKPPKHDTLASTLYHSNKHFSELYPQHGGEKTAGIDKERITSLSPYAYRFVCYRPLRLTQPPTLSCMTNWYRPRASVVWVGR